VVLFESDGGPVGSAIVAGRCERVTVSLFYWSLRRLLELLVLRRRSEREKEIEILLLRHQLLVLERQVARPQLTQADRALLAAFSLWVPKTRCHALASWEADAWGAQTCRGARMRCWRPVRREAGVASAPRLWRPPVVLVSLVYLVACRLLALVLMLARSDGSKELELLVLRHELLILRRQARRPQLTESDRLLLAALSRLMSRRSWHAFFDTPETLLRWHRRIVARRWTYPHRRPGRPPIDQAVRELIVRLARENSLWGYVRIVGELRKLGIIVSATLVRNVLARAGIPPAPERAASNWRSFLRQHGNTILACDFFTVDTVWLRRL
jgi:hypothetical protein